MEDKIGGGRRRMKGTSSSSKNVEETLYHQLAEKLAEEEEEDENEKKRRMGRREEEEICEKVWVKFANIHQKSPTHRNNNVRRCGGCAKVERHGRDFDDLDRRRRKTYGELLTSLAYIVFKTGFVFGVIFTFFYCTVVLHKPTQAIVSRNTQDLIYPFMRFFRLVAIPLVRNYPAVTKLYEDSCLVTNPYFSMLDIDCWPCETSKTIVDLTGFSNFSQVYHGSGIPFVVKDAFSINLGLEELSTIASENHELLFKIFQHSDFGNLSQFQSHLSQHPSSIVFSSTFSHIRWKINRVSAVRGLRKYFPKPYFIPNTTEVSVQHFLFLDRNQSPSYTLPRTEFANVFLTQATGTRYIVLIPTEWCSSRCRVLSVVLQAKDVLFYNWLFWKPISRPVERASTNLSITYVGSFY